MADDLERPTLPMWVWIVGLVLVVLGALTVVGWVLRSLFALARTGLFLALVVAAFVMLRGAFGRRR